MASKSQITLVTIILFSLFASLSNLPADLVFSGSSRSLFYSRENYFSPLEDESVHNFRLYQYMRMKLSGRGKKSSISFNTYLRVSDDLNVEYSNDPNWRLYNGYLQLDRGYTQLSVGRQWLHLGPGSMTLDGLKLSFGSPGLTQLTGYAGTESPYGNHFQLNGWDKAKSGGFYLSTRAIRPLTLGLGWYQKSRKGEVALREVGLKCKADLPRDLKLSAGLDVNLLTDRVQKGYCRLNYKGSKRLTFLAEFKHYEPRLFYQSYFRRFNPRANDQLRGGLVYFVTSQVTLNATYSAIFFEDADTRYLSLGAGCPNGWFNYYHGAGFGGDEDGFAVGGNYIFRQKIEIYADLDYSRYRFYEEDEDRDYLFSSIFGINWKPARNILAGLEFQDLNNQFFSKDFRVLLKFAVNYGRIF